MILPGFPKPLGGAVSSFPVFRSFATGTAPGNISAVNIDRPSGTSQGDLLLITANRSGLGTITAPAGWTQIASQASAYGSNAVFYKIATSSEPSSYSVSMGGNAFAAVVVVCYRDAKGVDVHGNGTFAAPDATNLSVASITPTKLGILIGAFSMTGGDPAPLSKPPTMNLVASSSYGGATITRFYSQEPMPPGSTGTRTFGLPEVASSMFGVLIQIY